MSEDANYDDLNGPTVCCIYACGEPSTVYLDSHWYCTQHGNEYETSRPKTCAEPGCEEAGVISSSNTTAKFCINHAWKQDRSVDENGLSHPTENTPRLVATIVSPLKPQSLEDLGTRWRHIADFQDYIADGLDAVTQILNKYPKPENIPAIDAARKKGLESALALIEVYQMKMAKFEQKKWDLNNVLDKCVPSREVLAQIKADKEHERARQIAEKNAVEKK